MLAGVLLTVASATTVSLSLDSKLECPGLNTLTDRLQRVGLTVLPQTPPPTEVLTVPTLEVSVKPTPGGLQLSAKRTLDGKVFERTVETGKEDCATVERLVAVLIHSWITAKMPVLSPASADAGKRP